MGDNLFRISEVVQLKSGGPSMTVEGYSSEDWVKVIWFNTNTYSFSKNEFKAPLLKKALCKD